MIDRDEFLRFRIENFLNEQRARKKMLQTGIGKVLVRQATKDGITTGAFASSRRKFRANERVYFIETPAEDQSSIARQLWLPELVWVELGTKRRREIIESREVPERRFEAWGAVQHLADDLDGYSAYSPEGESLFGDFNLALQWIGAVDQSFDLEVDDKG